MRKRPAATSLTALACSLFLAGLGAAPAPADEAPKAPVLGPQAPEPAPGFELDKKGKRLTVDFSKDLKPISDSRMKFADFAGHKLVLFYFSAKCPHCQHAFPYIQKLSEELKPQGVQTVAIAVKFNSEDDIRGFIRDYKVNVPVFHDEQRAFGDAYGTGSVPLILAVDEKGEYVRYKEFDEKKTPDLIKAEVGAVAQR